MFMDENYMVLNDYSDLKNKKADAMEDVEDPNQAGAENPNKIVTIDMGVSNCMKHKEFLMTKQRD